MMNQPNDPVGRPGPGRALACGIRTCSGFPVTVLTRLVHSRQRTAATSGGVVFARMRLIGAFAALITAAVVVGIQSAPPAPTGARTVDLRSTAAPMETTMKSPIVATTDPSPVDPCRDVPLDALQQRGLAFTPPRP